MFRNTHRLPKHVAAAMAVVALAVPATAAGIVDNRSPDAKDAAYGAERGVLGQTLSSPPQRERGDVDNRSPDAQDAAIDAQRGVSRQTLSSPPQRDRGYVDHRSPDAQDAAFDAQRGVSPATLSPSPPKTTVQATDSGFDWGDAGIGAGTVLGLVLIMLSVLFAVVHRRRRSVEGPGGSALTA